MGIAEEYKDFKPELINREYEENHIAILNVTKELTRQNGKTPSFRLIAEKTGLHPQTIYNHYKAIRLSQDVKPSYKKYAFEVLDRHIELMRQSNDLSIALKAVLTLEERLFDIMPKDNNTVKETKRLILEIDTTKQDLVSQNVQPADFTEVTDNED